MDWVAFFFGLALGLLLKSMVREKPREDAWTKIAQRHAENLLVGQEFYFVLGRQRSDDGGDWKEEDDLSGFDAPRFKKHEMN